MPFDANLVLRDGSVDLDNAEAVAVSTTANDDGAKVIDLGGTVKPRGNAEGFMGLAAVLVLPDIPTTYADTLAVKIQQSDHEAFGYEDLVYFPTLYAYTRLLNVLVTTAFASTDIGATLTGGTTGDTGVIRWMHPDALTAGNYANMIVTMVGADDLFDDVDETVTSSDTGVGTMNGAAAVEINPRLGGPHIHIRRFGATKRYLRGYLTASAGSNFGGAQLMLQPWAHNIL